MMDPYQRALEWDEQRPAPPDWLLYGTRQCLESAARMRHLHAQHVTTSRAAIAPSWTLLAHSGNGHQDGHQAGAARPTPPVAAGPRLSRPAARAEPGDLGGEIAAATFDAARRLTDERGLALEVADPEPLLRGMAGAYAAIACTLPGGIEEAWALLGLLALELEEADHRQRPPQRLSSSGQDDTPGVPWPEHRAPASLEISDGPANQATVSSVRTACSDQASPKPLAADVATAAERHIAETEAHMVHQATLIGHLAAAGRDTSLADTLLWLAGQTLDALHEQHRGAILGKAGPPAAQRIDTAEPPSP